MSMWRRGADRGPSAARRGESVRIGSPNLCRNVRRFNPCVLEAVLSCCHRRDISHPLIANITYVRICVANECQLREANFVDINISACIVHKDAGRRQRRLKVLYQIRLLTN